MKHRIFVRNKNAGDFVEVFLVSSVASLLLVRLFLHLSGYPQVGGDVLHIAHMLWGGFLMLISILMMLSYIGRRIQMLSAFIGGIGFGVFIDELGKFITKDNDYFYQPAIALIYGIFIVLFLLYRYFIKNPALTPREALLNALLQLEEAVHQDMDRAEVKRIQQLLKEADQKDPLTIKLTQFIKSTEVLPERKPIFSFFQNGKKMAVELYISLLRKKSFKTYARLIIVGEGLFLLLLISTLIGGTFRELYSGRDILQNLALFYIIGEAASAAIAAILVMRGLFAFTDSRMRAYSFFRQAAIVQIFLTTFFMFYREQFGALPNLLLNILFLLLLSGAISAERSLADDDNAEERKNTD